MGFFADASLVLLVLLGLFLILVVLLQRGRGGGLAGALGGAGGQSAFGTRSGDVFTWITAGTAAVWFILAGVAGVLTRKSSNSIASRVDAGQVTQDDQSTADDDDRFQLQQDAPPEAPVPGFGGDINLDDLTTPEPDNAASAAPVLPGTDDEMSEEPNGSPADDAADGTSSGDASAETETQTGTESDDSEPAADDDAE